MARGSRVPIAPNGSSGTGLRGRRRGWRRWPPAVARVRCPQANSAWDPGLHWSPSALQSHLSRLGHSCPRVNARAPAGTPPQALVTLTPEQLGGEGSPSHKGWRAPCPALRKTRGSPHPAEAYRESLTPLLMTPPHPHTSQSLQHSLQPFGKDFVPFSHTSHKDGVIFRSSQNYQGAPRVLGGSPHHTRVPGASLTCRPSRCEEQGDGPAQPPARGSHAPSLRQRGRQPGPRSVKSVQETRASRARAANARGAPVICSISM